MIRQGFWSSPHHPGDPWARLLFMAMWNFADDYGVGSASTREILGYAFPNDRNISENDLEQLLRDVGKAYGVLYYTVGGRPYYSIPSWLQHQKVPHPSKTRNPGIEDAEHWLYQDEYESSGDPHESHMTFAIGSPQQSVSLSDKYKEKVKEKEKDPPPSSVGQAPEPTLIRGTRLRDDWQPSVATLKKLTEAHPSIRLDLILAEFVNYWTALPGQRATKIDWNKTFVNRVNERANAPQFQINASRVAYADGGRALTGTEVAYAKLTALAHKYSQENSELQASSVQGDDEGQGLLALS
ncbi:MAG: DnaT-like ssDNA-binding domain-containing protein [Planctomycetota bacterium]